MLFPNSRLDNLDFLISQPVQLVHNLINQRVRRLDFRFQFLGTLFRLDITP